MSISIPGAGELNTRIDIVRRIDKPAGGFQVQQEDTVIFTCWAKVEPTGGAYWGASQIENRTTHRFWVRTVNNRTDVYSLNHGVLILMNKRYYRPVRVTDANNMSAFTVIEACEIGDFPAENSNSKSVMSEALDT